MIFLSLRIIALVQFAFCFFKLFVSCFYYMHKTSVLDAMCKRFFVVFKNS